MVASTLARRSDIPDAQHSGRTGVYAHLLRTRYLVARGHPSPERLQARLDEAAGDALRETLANLLTTHVDPADDTIWLIRQLEIDVSMNTAWDRNQLGRVWAQRIALALLETFSAGPDDGNVKRFRSRSDYVACFLSDLVVGQAWSRWYYRTFDGLRALPISAAVRTIVVRDPVVGFDALLALPADVLVRVLSTLTPHDARWIARAVPEAGTTIAPLDALGLVLHAYEQLHGDTGLSGDARSMLRLILESIRVRPEHSGETVTKSAYALITLVRIAISQPRIVQQIRRAITQSGLAGLYTVVSAADAEALTPLCHADTKWFARVESLLAVTHIPASSQDDASDVDIRATPFGGAFLLLPMLLSSPVETLVETLASEWPECRKTSAVSLLRLLVLAKCLGGSSLPRLMLDPVMRDLFQIDPSLSLTDVAEWLSTLAPRYRPEIRAMGLTKNDARYLAFPLFVRETSSIRKAIGRVAIHVLRDFSRRLPGFARASFAHLQVNFLSVSATLEQQPGRRVVRLSRPPLDVILNMTGMSRTTYRLPWLDDRPFVLFPESVV
jgi:hypothetical protein